MKCEICGKNHQKIVKVRIIVDNKKIVVDTMRSPCLDKIFKEAVHLTNRITKKEK